MVSFSKFLNNVNQWLQTIPLKALNNAYQSAIKIKAIEDQHFQGKMISADGEGGKSVYDYYKSALDRELAKINLNLTQLRISNFFELGKSGLTNKNTSENEVNLEQEIREKLHFIESIIGKYRQAEEEKLIFVENSLDKSSLPPQLSSEIDDDQQQNPNFIENIENRIEQKINQRRRRYSQEYE